MAVGVNVWVGDGEGLSVGVGDAVSAFENVGVGIDIVVSGLIVAVKTDGLFLIVLQEEVMRKVRKTQSTTGKKFFRMDINGLLGIKAKIPMVLLAEPILLLGERAPHTSSPCSALYTIRNKYPTKVERNREHLTQPPNGGFTSLVMAKS